MKVTVSMNDFTLCNIGQVEALVLQAALTALSLCFDRQLDLVDVGFLHRAMSQRDTVSSGSKPCRVVEPPW